MIIISNFKKSDNKWGLLANTSLLLLFFLQ